MTDLLERLRQVEGNVTRYYRNPDGPEAAEEIDRLRALASQINTDWIPANRKLCDRIEQLRADYTRLLDEYDQQEARLAEAEALLRETQMHLLYHGLARGLRELVDAFFVGDKP